MQKLTNNPYSVEVTPFNDTLESLDAMSQATGHELHPLNSSARLAYEAVCLARGIFFQAKIRDFNGADIAAVAGLILNNRDKA